MDLMVGYLDGNLLVLELPFIGRFQYVCSPKPLSIFVRVGMRLGLFVLCVRVDDFYALF